MDNVPATDDSASVTSGRRGGSTTQKDLPSTPETAPSPTTRPAGTLLRPPVRGCGVGGGAGGQNEGRGRRREGVGPLASSTGAGRRDAREGSPAPRRRRVGGSTPQSQESGRVVGRGGGGRPASGRASGRPPRRGPFALSAPSRPHRARAAGPLGRAPAGGGRIRLPGRRRL